MLNLLDCGPTAPSVGAETVDDPCDGLDDAVAAFAAWAMFAPTRRARYDDACASESSARQSWAYSICTTRIVPSDPPRTMSRGCRTIG